MAQQEIEEDAALEEQYQAMNQERSALRAQLHLIREKPLNKLTKTQLKEGYEALVDELLFSYETWQSRVERRLKLNEIMALETQKLVEEKQKQVDQLKELNGKLVARLSIKNQQNVSRK